MVITPKNKTGNKKTSVIITDYSPLTENLIDLLKDIRPDFSLVNGDQEQCKYTFLKTLQPRILILDPGFICNDRYLFQGKRHN